MRQVGMLNRLVYFSERKCSERSIETIMAKAAARNKVRGVTGLLMADEASFIQILEGPRGAVSQLFQQISRDRRHKGVILVEMTEIAAPSYPAWGMAYVCDQMKVEAAWNRVMRKKVEPWAIDALQLRGLLKIAMGDAKVAAAPAPLLATA